MGSSSPKQHLAGDRHRGSADQQRGAVRRRRAAGRWRQPARSAGSGGGPSLIDHLVGVQGARGQIF
jgi:hypothetical protein